MNANEREWGYRQANCPDPAFKFKELNPAVKLKASVWLCPNSRPLAFNGG
jgi:hypothetical protein